MVVSAIYIKVQKIQRCIWGHSASSCILKLTLLIRSDFSYIPKYSFVSYDICSEFWLVQLSWANISVRIQWINNIVSKSLLETKHPVDALQCNCSKKLNILCILTAICSMTIKFHCTLDGYLTWEIVHFIQLAIKLREYTNQVICTRICLVFDITKYIQWLGIKLN